MKSAVRFIKAIKRNDIDYVKESLDADMSLANSKSMNGAKTTPLMMATCVGNENMMSLLIDKGSLESNPHILHYAARYFSLDTVKFYIDRGLDVDAGDDAGNTPMVNAILGRRIDNVKYLLSLSEVNIANDSGATPLMCACYVDDLSIVSLLLAQPVITTCVDNKGNNILHYAAGLGYKFDNFAVLPWLINQIGDDMYSSKNFLGTSAKDLVDSKFIAVSKRKTD